MNLMPRIRVLHFQWSRIIQLLLAFRFRFGNHGAVDEDEGDEKILSSDTRRGLRGVCIAYTRRTFLTIETDNPKNETRSKACSSLLATVLEDR